MDPDPIGRSLTKLNHVAKRGVSAPPKTLIPIGAYNNLPPKPKTQKIMHRQVSFSHPSVHVSPSPKYSQWPDGLIRKLDLKRNEQDNIRGYCLEEIREDNVIPGRADPWSLPKAGSPGNLYSGYGNNRKMFNNVRARGD
ncbi:unnamed protein product [Amoebophrya sp. A25]|nr:unnamed protein product [Amoebophrya sp. A25]|eukprot:GSA25T00008535001.1